MDERNLVKVLASYGFTFQEKIVPMYKYSNLVTFYGYGPRRIFGIHSRPLSLASQAQIIPPASSEVMPSGHRQASKDTPVLGPYTGQSSLEPWQTSMQGFGHTRVFYALHQV